MIAVSAEATQTDFARFDAQDFEVKMRRFAPIPVRKTWLRRDPHPAPVTFSPKIDAAIERARDAVADALDTISERFARDRRTGLTIGQVRRIADAAPRLRGLHTGEAA